MKKRLHDLELRHIEEVDGLNRRLEARVEEQMAELVRTGELKRFLPHQVAEGLMAGQLSPDEGFERRKVTLLFADMVGFTDLSDKLEPEELAEVLNGYLREMTAEAVSQGGNPGQLHRRRADGALRSTQTRGGVAPGLAGAAHGVRDEGASRGVDHGDPTTRDPRRPQGSGRGEHGSLHCRGPRQRHHAGLQGRGLRGQRRRATPVGGRARHRPRRVPNLRAGEGSGGSRAAGAPDAQGRRSPRRSLGDPSDCWTDRATQTPPPP